MRSAMFTIPPASIIAFIFFAGARLAGAQVLSPATRPGSCVDTDGGAYVYIAGEACALDICQADVCLNGGASLSESYCLDSKVECRTYDCALGCIDGACVGEPSAICVDPDHSADTLLLSAYTRTTVTTGNGEHLTDVCTDTCPPAVREYGCDNHHQIVRTDVTCNGACADGQCAPSFQTADAISYTRTAPRPNILLIISDDQDYEMLGFAGHPNALTPNIDKLASTGLVFENGTSTMSRCRPVLATLLSGQYPHENNIYFNYLDEPTPDTRFLATEDALPALLRDSGYSTFMAGKFWEGNPLHYGFTHIGERAWALIRTTQQSVFDFIEEQATRDEPFFMWYAPKLPHVPHDPPADYLALFDKTAIDVPPWISPENDPHFRDAQVELLAMIYWLDVAIGEVLQKLEDTGQRDNTVVIFLIDNGWANGFVSKGSAYEKGIRTPIIIQTPLTRLKPKRSGQLASVVDIPPTILDYAGLPIPNSYSGRSLRPWVLEEAGRLRQRIVQGVYPAYTRFGENAEADLQDDLYSVLVKDRQFKFVTFTKDVLPGDNARSLRIKHSFVPFPTRHAGDEEFFDLLADPYEEENMIYSGQHLEKITTMRAISEEFVDSLSLDGDISKMLSGHSVNLLTQSPGKPSCDYGQSYDSPYYCDCRGELARWSIFREDGHVCTPSGDTVFVCRNVPIDEVNYVSAVPGEIEIRAERGVTLDELWDQIDKSGAIVREYTCHWDRTSLFNRVLAETTPGTETIFMEAIRASGLARYVQQVPQVVCLK